MMRPARGTLLLFAIAVAACGGEDDDVAVQLVLPDVSELTCGSTKPAGLSATLFVSGNMAPCNLSVDAAGLASGSCGNIPTGITRYLVLRYTVTSGGNVLPLRYAIASADLTPAHLRGKSSSVPIRFANDGTTGMYVDSDADVARLRDLLYGPKTMLTSALCFARSVIAADAGTTEVAGDCRAAGDVKGILDVDGDACTNLRELCDGTSPTDAGSASSCN